MMDFDYTEQIYHVVEVKNSRYRAIRRNTHTYFIIEEWIRHDAWEAVPRGLIMHKKTGFWLETGEIAASLSDATEMLEELFREEHKE